MESKTTRGETSMLPFHHDQDEAAVINNMLEFLNRLDIPFGDSLSSIGRDRSGALVYFTHADLKN